jgi:hypothetical protein
MATSARKHFHLNSLLYSSISQSFENNCTQVANRGKAACTGRKIRILSPFETCGVLHEMGTTKWLTALKVPRFVQQNDAHGMLSNGPGTGEAE